MNRQGRAAMIERRDVHSVDDPALKLVLKREHRSNGSKTTRAVDRW